jgi:hypothetical protein
VPVSCWHCFHSPRAGRTRVSVVSCPANAGTRGP